MGREADNGLGWSPDAFWRATVYDIERAIAFTRRNNKNPDHEITREDADRLKKLIEDARVEERAAHI